MYAYARYMHVYVYNACAVPRYIYNYIYNYIYACVYIAMPAHARYVTHAPVQTTTKDQEQPKRLILKNISHNTELEYTKYYEITDFVKK